jgi:hypothetical protein
MIEIVVTPSQIAAGITERGDVAITGVDPQFGTTVTIVVESTHWKTVLEKLGRLKGVGIYKANRLPIVGVDGTND